MIKKCLKCGEENEIGEFTLSTECPSCGIIYAKYEKRLAQQKAQQEADQKAAQDAEQKVPARFKIQDNKKNENKLVNPVIVISVIMALAISFVGYKIYLNLESRNAKREFSFFVGTISDKMIKLAIDSENVVDEINRAWHDAIYSDYNKRDFNVVIIEVKRRRLTTILSIKDLSEEIAKSIKRMNPPAGMESDYKRLKDLYLLFDKYANMAITPSGSLQTYSRQNSELSVEIKSAVKELEMMR